MSLATVSPTKLVCCQQHRRRLSTHQKVNQWKSSVPTKTKQPRWLGSSRTERLSTAGSTVPGWRSSAKVSLIWRRNTLRCSWTQSKPSILCKKHRSLFTALDTNSSVFTLSPISVCFTFVGYEIPLKKDPGKWSLRDD